MGDVLMGLCGRADQGSFTLLGGGTREKLRKTKA